MTATRRLLLRRPAVTTAVVLALTVAATVAVAEAPTSIATGTDRSAVGTTRTGPTEAADSAAVAAVAADWGLSVAEYRRYHAAMQNLRGRLSDPGITPVEVLGIEADSDAERRRYAEMWVRLIAADTAKVLAFSRAVHEAWQRLHPDTPMVDRARIDALRRQAASPFPPIAPAGGSDAAALGPRVMVFTRLDCGPCNAVVRRVLAGLKVPGADEAVPGAVDIFLLDANPGEDDRVRAWAHAVPVPMDLAAAGRVTVNFDLGRLDAVSERLGITPGPLPVVVAVDPDGDLRLHQP